MSFCLYFADAAALVFPSDHVPSFAAPPVPAARATAALCRRGVLRARTRSHGRRPQCRHRKCETGKLEGEQPDGIRLGIITPAVGSGHAIVVNQMGRRYAAEHKVTKDPSRYFFYKEAVKFNIDTLDYANSPSWFIFDETLRKQKPLVDPFSVKTSPADHAAAPNADRFGAAFPSKKTTLGDPKMMKQLLSMSFVLFSLGAFGISTASADEFLADRHAKYGLPCTACHVENGSPKLKIDDQKHEACVGCHGWYDEVAKKTVPKDEANVNPHSQHDGNLPCTECHKGHKKGYNYCGDCHMYNYNVP